MEILKKVFIINVFLILFSAITYSQYYWFPSPEGIYTPNAIWVSNPYDINRCVWLGYYRDASYDYGFIEAWDEGSQHWKDLLIYGSKIGVNLRSPIQEFDINGRLVVRNGVIQNGTTAITTTLDLGLYSRNYGQYMRFVTNHGDIRFFTNGDINPIGDGWGTLVISNNGSVGIGLTTYLPDVNYKLNVDGKIKAKGIRVQSNWSDFVFKPDYKLMSLGELNLYINENGHLPDVPSESEVAEKGVELGDMTSKLLQKVEELTLYMIQQNNEIEKLRKENDEIKSILNK